MPLFAPIAAPVLRSVDPVEAARFVRERERYELEITSKQVEMPTLKVLPYTASVDRTLLKSLFYMGKFDEIAKDATNVADLTDTHIETYVKALVTRPDTASFNPTIIKSALVGFAMPKIVDADDRITTYWADFFERLEGVGCSSFTENNPKKAGRLLVSHLELPALKNETRKRLEYDEALQTSVKIFIKALIQEGINCQTYGQSKTTEVPKPADRNPKIVQGQRL